MILEDFLNVVELSDPGLYDALDGDEARRELEALVSNTGVIDRSTLVVINGEPQRIVRVQKIGARKIENSHWLLEVPVVVVEKKWTTPPKQSLTKAKTG